MSQELAMREKPVGELVTRGRLEMVYKGDFFSELVMSLSPYMIADSDETMIKRIWRDNKPTMATDGKHLFFAESFVRTLTFKQMLFIFVHEGLHKGLGHCLRLRGYNQDIMNICCDVIVNQMVIDHAPQLGLETPPDIVTIENTKQYFAIPVGVRYQELPYKYSCEELYRMWVQKSGEEGGKGAPKPGWGYIVEPTDDAGGELTSEELEVEKVKQSIETAAAADRANGRKAGSVPGTIQDEIDRMRKPVVDWRRVLSEFLTGAKPSRTSWERLNKRYRRFAKLPSYRKAQFGELMIFIDTSGSVSDSWLEQFLGEQNKISQSVEFEKITVVPVDYSVQEQAIRTFKSGERITSMRVDGRGGTSFVYAFEWLKANPQYKPYRIIYFSDLEGEFPRDPYHVPTLWVSTTSLVAPWGKTINIQEGG